MPKLIHPKPMFLKGSAQAVLLLHSYTSTYRDVKPLAVFLNQHQYTCYSFSYAGHGLMMDEFLKFNPDDWWQEVIQAYNFLIELGYREIAVIGVSLGALLSLKLAESFPVSACISMSAPQTRSVEDLFQRLSKYAEYLQQFETDQQVLNIAQLYIKAQPQLEQFENFVVSTMQNLNKIHAPTATLFGKLDEALYEQSAHYIFEQISSSEKMIKAYPHSGHLMTLGQDQSILFKDILNFLNLHLSNT